MIHLKFNSAGRPTNLHADPQHKEIKKMLDYFTENQFNSELIRATNTLNDIDRCILAMYIVNNLNLTKTAKELHASTQYLKKRLQDIIEAVKEEVDEELFDEELEKIHIL